MKTTIGSGLIVLPAALAAAAPAHAQYPTKTVRLLVPFPAGRGTTPWPARLDAAAASALASREVKERFAATDLEPAASTPEQFGAHVRAG